MVDMSEIQFTKDEIAKLLNINPKEKKSRILKYMNNIFKLNDNCNCYSEGRGKNIIFIVNIPIEAKAYINLKLWLLNRYNFKVSYDYNLCLKLIYFLMNNKELISNLIKVSDRIGECYNNVKYYREIMLNDIISRQELCQQQVFADDKPINFEIYEDINRTFKNMYNKLSKRNCIRANDLLEIYSVTDNYEVIGINDTNYDDIAYQLEIQGYELVESGYMNSYLKSKLYQLHIRSFGYDDITIKTIYTLCPYFMKDKEFKQLVRDAFYFYKHNLKECN